MTTPITDADLADIETDAKDARALGYVRMRMLTDDVDSLVHRLRTSEADHEWWKTECHAATEDLRATRAELLGHAEASAALRARAEKAEAEVARLMAALKPFAAVAEFYDPYHEADDFNILADMGELHVTNINKLSHFRAAATALAASRPDPAQPGQSSAKPAAYLVWSNEHRMWWRPDERGYTTALASAGRYSREHALRIARNARGGWPINDIPPEVAIAEQDAIDAATPPAAGSAAGMG